MNLKHYITVLLLLTGYGMPHNVYAADIPAKDIDTTISTVNMDNAEEINKLERKTKLHALEQNKVTNPGNIQITTKKIGKIVTDKNYNSAMTLKAGESLSVARLDQLVENLKTNLTEPIILLEPTADDDIYNVIIRTKRHKDLQVDIALDDDNDSSYGHLNSYLTIARDYNFLPGDSLSVVLREHLSENRYKHTGGLRYLHYGAPLGKFKMGMTKYRNFQKERLPRSANLLNTYSDNLNIGVSNTYYRDQHKKLGYELTFKSIKNINKINDVTINITSNQYKTLTLGFNGLYYGNNSILSINPSIEIYRKNLAKNIAEVYNKNYIKWQMMGVYSKNYAKTSRYYDNYTASWGISYAPMHQLNNRQFSIGGVNSVRGFKHSTVRADKGLYVQNTFTRHFRHWSPFVGLDIGISRDYALPENDLLIGLAVGSSYQAGNFTANITIAQPLHVGYHMNKEHLPVYISMNYSF